jgi:5'-nucleotidase
MARLLLTNDDGVHGTGLQTLARALQEEHDVWIVAPSLERSTTGHTLTLDKPLHLVQVERQVWGCSGFPADCAFIGLGHVMKDNLPDLVLSGINYGANLGQDIYYSGTVAAAREAYFRGRHALGLSLALNFQERGGPHYFGDAAEFVKDFIADPIFQELLRHDPWLININFPNLPRKEWRSLALAHQGRRYYSEKIERRVDCRDREYFWICGQYEGHNEEEGSDCSVVGKGEVSLSLLGAPMPHRNSLFNDRESQVKPGELSKHFAQIEEKFRFELQNALKQWNHKWFGKYSS